MADKRPPEISTPASVGADSSRRGVPPLVWIVLALLVVMAVWGAMNWRGTHVTPSGGTAPTVSEQPQDQH